MPNNETGWDQSDQDRQGRSRTDLAAVGRTWPKSRENMILEVERRRSAYLGLAYTDAEITGLSLFRAHTAARQLSAQTSRVMRDLAYVTDVDAASIASGGLRLSIEEGRDDSDTLNAIAREVWERSEIDESRLWWATTVCSEGEILLETVQTEAGPAIVMHPFDAYRLTYDRTGKQIIQCVIDLTLPGVETVGPDGKIEIGDVRKYRRILTPTQIRVWIDEVPSTEETGPNTLGVVPVVRICHRRVGDGTFCQNSGYGYDDLIAALDSMLCQMRTIATRHAHPILLGIGVSAGESAELQNQGATASIPEGTELKWLEAALSGIDALVKTMVEVRAAMVQTLPQFLFTEAGASASGTALSYRAAAFVMYIEPIRAAFYRGMERAIGYAVAIARGVTWAELGNVIEVSGGPAIPQDIIALATAYTALREAGAITGSDLAAHLQGSGIASDEASPADYAAAALSELLARQGGTSETIGKLQALLDAISAMGAGDRMDSGETETPAPAEPATDPEAPPRS